MSECGAKPLAVSRRYNSLKARMAMIAKKTVKYGDPRITIQIMMGMPIIPMMMRFARVLMQKSELCE
jgi:hypothetical protein